MVDEQNIAAYERDGVICLRQVIDRDWIERLRKAEDVVRNNPSSGSRITGQAEAKFFKDRFVWTLNDTFKDFAFASALPSLAAQFMRSQSVFLLTDLIFTKDPHTQEITPWHHDKPYGWYDGEQVCQFWIPMDYVDLNSGTLELVRGSHRWGKWFNMVDFSAKEYETSEYEDLPEIDANREQYDIVSFDMEPGDCILFSELTLHSAPGNRSSRPRRGLALHYAGDDARYAVRRHSRRPPVDPGIKHGDPFGCDLFPRVWTSNR
jgi:ectoine hydroxylase-related dioxygenase (phytanoyl-CoA dioxygenase family)